MGIDADAVAPFAIANLAMRRVSFSFRRMFRRFLPIQSQLWHDFSSLSIVVINWEQFIMKWGWIIWMSGI